MSPTEALVPWWSLRRPSPRRSLLFAGVGAAAGLVIAGFGLFTAQGTRTLAVPAEDAAIVNTTPVLMSDYVGEIRARYAVPLAQATAAQRRKTLDDMIREELYAQRGIELGLAEDDTDVRQALVAGTESTVAQDALTERPPPSELRHWFDAHPDVYASEGQMTLREFVLPPGRAREVPTIIAALHGGVAPAALNLRSSGRVDDGAEFYFAARAHLGEPLFRIARTLGDGAVSAPVAARDGIHILVMVHNQPPVRIAYADVEDRVQRDLLNAKVAQLQAANDQFLRRRADIRIAAQLR